MLSRRKIFCFHFSLYCIVKIRQTRLFHPQKIIKWVFYPAYRGASPCTSCHRLCSPHLFICGWWRAPSRSFHQSTVRENRGKSGGYCCLCTDFSITSKSSCGSGIPCKPKQNHAILILKILLPSTIPASPCVSWGFSCSFPVFFSCWHRH